MNLLEIFTALHSSNHVKIHSVLTRSTYIEKCASTLIEANHTGFRFKIHTGSKFDLFFHVKELGKIQLVHQLSVDFRQTPLIAGLRVARSDRYFNLFHPTVPTGWTDSTQSHSIDYQREEIVNNRLRHSTFRFHRKGNAPLSESEYQIVEKDVIAEFPLSKEHEEPYYLHDGELYLNRQDYWQVRDFDTGDY